MRKQWKLLGAGLVLAVLAACGGGGGGTAAVTAAPALTGLAATGAGIANATVTARCSSGPVITGSTDANGVFNLLLGSSTAPCMVQVTGGTPAVTLYSFANAAGRVNITPVTDMLVARALGDNPATQFTAFDSAKAGTINTNLVAAKTYVNNQLSAVVGAGLALDPLSGAFAVGDADDKLLDALGAAMLASTQTIDQLRTVAKDNSALSGVVPPYLAAPASPTATANSSTQITLNWQAVAGATGYAIYRSTAASVALVDGNKITATPVSTAGAYPDTGLSAATAYYYKVVASNAVATSAGSSEVTATTSAAGGSTGGSGSTALQCDTSKFGSGASVVSPSSNQLASFAATYTGSEGSYGTNPGDPFVATGSASLVLSSSGGLTYNSNTLTPTSYCLQTLSGGAGTQLVIHAGTMAHFDLKTTGSWSGYTDAGKVVNDTAYTAGGSGSGSTSFGSLAITGTASGIQGATVPSTFTPTAFGTHPTAKVSWSMPGASTWYITLNGDVISSTAGFGSWQKSVPLTGIVAEGVAFNMASGQITFTNVTLPAFAAGQTGNMVLNGTLSLPAATGTAVAISGTGSGAAGSGLDAPAASVSSVLIGSTTKTTYTWDGGKGISLVFESYSSGSKTLTLSNAAGPVWRNLSPGTSVTLDTAGKTVTFSAASLAGLSPTSTAVQLSGSLTIP